MNHPHTPPAPVPPSASGLQSLEAACQHILDSLSAIEGSQWVDTDMADGRVLAADVVSALNVPAFDNSAMDGYALHSRDAAQGQSVWPVSQRIAAGQVGQALAPGHAARIFTGAALPQGADAVVMQELTQVLPAPNVQGQAQVQLLAPVTAGMAVRRAGEDVRCGATVLTAGTRLQPAHLGLVASLGQAQVQVRRRPRVALFSTGDELVMPGQVPPEQLPAGAIYNANRFFLLALLRRWGCEVTDAGALPDTRQATQSALAAAAQTHDLLVTSGGVSVGEEDHVKPAVQALGQLQVWQIAMKPGKPFAFGHVRLPAADAASSDTTPNSDTSTSTSTAAPQPALCHVVGLPGNPVSSMVTAMLLLRPVVQRLQGQSCAGPLAQWPCQRLRADFDWPRADTRREFLRVRRNAQGGLDVFAQQSSGVLTSVVWADGLLDKAAGQTIAAGDMVNFYPFAQVLA